MLLDLLADKQLRIGKIREQFFLQGEANTGQKSSERLCQNGDELGSNLPSIIGSQINIKDDHDTGQHSLPQTQNLF